MLGDITVVISVLPWQGHMPFQLDNNSLVWLNCVVCILYSECNCVKRILMRKENGLRVNSKSSIHPAHFIHSPVFPLRIQTMFRSLLTVVPLMLLSFMIFQQVST